MRVATGSAHMDSAAELAILLDLLILRAVEIWCDFRPALALKSFNSLSELIHFRLREIIGHG